MTIAIFRRRHKFFIRPQCRPSHWALREDVLARDQHQWLRCRYRDI